MTFDDFINAPRALAMVITVEEYRRIKPLLQDFYSERDIQHIDDNCKFKWGCDRFLLCNPHETAKIGTPTMFLSAVTFVDRILFKNIQFEGE